MRYVTHLAAAAALVLAGAMGVATHAGDASVRRVDQLDVADVYCPSEDSCTWDYRPDGTYSVRLRAVGSW